MTSTHRSARHARRLFTGRARVLAAGFMVFLAEHLAGPLRAQSFAACGANICASPTTANVGIGTSPPGYPLDIQSPNANQVHVQITSPADSKQAAVILENDRGGYLSFGGLFYGGSGYASYPLFGLSRADRYFDITGGANNLGMVVGTLNAAPLTLGTNNAAAMTILSGGNVGIGTVHPQSLLAVNGTISTKEVIVTNTGWSDYVFKPDYALKPLQEVAAYIKEHRHLPEIPSETEVQEKGVSLGGMQVKLLAKIEELTLHAIQADEKNRELQARIARLEARGVKRVSQADRGVEKRTN